RRGPPVRRHRRAACREPAHRQPRGRRRDGMAPAWPGDGARMSDFQRAAERAVDRWRETMARSFATEIAPLLQRDNAPVAVRRLMAEQMARELERIAAHLRDLKPIPTRRR